MMDTFFLGYYGTTNDWDNYSRYVNPDGVHISHVQEQCGERDVGEEDVPHLLFFVDVLLLTLVMWKLDLQKDLSLHQNAPGGESAMGMGKKIFIGTLPQEASVEDLCWYFGRFGRILNVYIPKDPKRSGHRGFGFVTFGEDGVADCVSRRSHEICG
ncbi:putative RNA recognition motif domain, nucleotide-binding alpha-beta plait domain superfamily [Helianthus annuus]|nr:putative RNA recognition motif domain, nucleotide-binding alpha-beta plait domain superfamily [Helianthus annuus]KAJ0459232.1 putative RNA recognition motif domain, nucleotide-binding alpha-beta plait domain superfamily [Helianthus annuus]KAJ0639790.1 putative RNA recognition motif domain, nucleotide-binding alpha-beta plait domain superfamily [Helianthus annuus]